MDDTSRVVNVSSEYAVHIGDNGTGLQPARSVNSSWKHLKRIPQRPELVQFGLLCGYGFIQRLNVLFHLLNFIRDAARILVCGKRPAGERQHYQQCQDYVCNKFGFHDAILSLASAACARTPAVSSASPAPPPSNVSVSRRQVGQGLERLCSFVGASLHLIIACVKRLFTPLKVATLLMLLPYLCGSSQPPLPPGHAVTSPKGAEVFGGTRMAVALPAVVLPPRTITFSWCHPSNPADGIISFNVYHNTNSPSLSGMTLLATTSAWVYTITATNKMEFFQVKAMDSLTHKESDWGIRGTCGN